MIFQVGCVRCWVHSGPGLKKGSQVKAVIVLLATGDGARGAALVTSLSHNVRNQRGPSWVKPLARNTDECPRCVDVIPAVSNGYPSTTCAPWSRA